MRSRAAWAAVCLASIWAAPAPASPWTRAAGDYYLNVSYARIRASSYFDSTGAVRELPSAYSQQVVAIYGELGVVDRWLTLVADWQALRAVRQEGLGSEAGVGDLRLGATTGLVRGPLVVSASVIAGLPIGDPAPASSPGHPGSGLNLQTGSGDFSLEGRLEAGHGFGGAATQGYWSLGAGWRKRGISPRSGTEPTPETGRYEDQILTGFEVGLRFLHPGWERWWFSFRAAGLYPLGAAGQAVDSYSGLRAGTRYTALVLGADMRVAGRVHLGGKAEGALGPREVPRTIHLKVYAAVGK
ncbi:MAG: hypothetical protein HZB25_06390 [Candidatus Eisenbacteria bacterium]|nr:hypothetical protein [Candidatus Eisenbacteria bacterium]